MLIVGAADSYGKCWCVAPFARHIALLLISHSIEIEMALLFEIETRVRSPLLRHRVGLLHQHAVFASNVWSVLSEYSLHFSIF